MAESTTIQVAETKTTERFAVYDSPDGDDQQEMVGTYITEQVAEQLGEYVEVELSAGEGEGLTLTPDKETASFVVMSSDADAVEAAYISHEVLGRLSDDDSEPETVNMLARSSTEAAFDEALAAQTITEDEAAQEANALLDEAADDSDEAEAESAESDEEQSAEDAEAEALVAGDVSDDELGI